ncbi:MAG: TetR/AcrR family transcriptional regulator [bacterium]|nr:TetR/AcrR family transcriptional regulator [bacterium]
MSISNEVFQLKKDHFTKNAMAIYLKHIHSSISINDICKEISISKKTFYKYFQSKDELLLEVDKRILKEIFIPEFKDLGKTENNYEKFSLLIRKFVDMGFRKSAYFNFFYSNFSSIKTLIAKTEFKLFREFRVNYSNLFSEVYEDGIKDGSIKPVKAFSCLNILRSLNGMLLYMITELEIDKQTEEQSYEEITSYVDHILDAIKSK